MNRAFGSILEMKNVIRKSVSKVIDVLLFSNCINSIASMLYLSIEFIKVLKVFLY